MTVHSAAIGDLQSAIAAIDSGQCATALHRIADLFLSGSARYSGDQIVLFDEIMSRLVAEVDFSVRASFGERLARDAYAPPQTMRLLALDDAIEVAGPVLLQSMRLDEDTLVEGARTKGQDHLLAISGRERLTPAVTDVLVERGDRRVAIGVAGNLGAEFSDFGYSTLVLQSHDDDRLAVCMWSRPEIPRQHLLRLFSEASEAVKGQLETADRRRGELVRGLIGQAANQLQTATRDRSAEYSAAHSRVHQLYDSGNLSEDRLAAFACAGQFVEVAISLSILCDLPIGLVERALAHDRSDQILVLARAMGLSWATTKSILLLQAGGNGTSTQELEQYLATFTRLKIETAKKALQFYRLRERADALN